MQSRISAVTAIGLALGGFVGCGGLAAQDSSEAGEGGERDVGAPDGGSTRDGGIHRLPEGGSSDSAVDAPGGDSTVERVTLTLASMLLHAGVIAVDSTSVYCGTYDSLVKVPLAGGTVTTLATNAPADKFTVRTGLAVDSESVYWDDNTAQAVLKVPIGGGKTTTLARTAYLGGYFNLAIDATSVYWGDETGSLGAVRSVPLGGGAPANLTKTKLRKAMTDYAVAVAVDTTNVYWTDPNAHALLTVPIGGGATATLASGLKNPGGIAVDATRAYWTDITAGTVMSVPLAGSKPTTLASGQGTPLGIAVDGASVYWTDESAGTVMKIPRDGGATTTLHSGSGAPWGIAVDATSVYWSDDRDWTLMKVTPK